MKLYTFYTFNFESSDEIGPVTGEFQFAANNIAELVSLINSHCGDYDQSDDIENYDTETLLALVTAIHNFDYIESETDRTEPQLVRSDYQ